MLDEMKSKPWAVENYCLVHFLQIRVGMFMGYAGMPIDMNKFNKWVDEVIATRGELLNKLRDWSGDQLFNPNSVAELQHFFYGKLGMPLPVGIRLKAEKARKGKVKSAPVSMSYAPLTDFDDSMFVTDTELTESTDKVPEVPVDLDRYPTDKTAIRFLMEQNPQHSEKLQTLMDYRWYSKVISNYLSKPNLLVHSMTDKNVKVLLYHPSIASTVTCR
jgi:DNA polymerase I-like protein with 3'-5' exonuclease and polymerase domains